MYYKGQRIYYILMKALPILLGNLAYFYTKTHYGTTLISISGWFTTLYVLICIICTASTVLSPRQVDIAYEASRHKANI